MMLVRPTHIDKLPPTGITARRRICCSTCFAAAERTGGIATQDRRRAQPGGFGARPERQRRDGGGGLLLDAALSGAPCEARVGEAVNRAAVRFAICAVVRIVDMACRCESQIPSPFIPCEVASAHTLRPTCAVPRRLAARLSKPLGIRSSRKFVTFRLRKNTGELRTDPARGDRNEALEKFYRLDQSRHHFLVVLAIKASRRLYRCAYGYRPRHHLPEHCKCCRGQTLCVLFPEYPFYLQCHVKRGMGGKPVVPNHALQLSDELRTCVEAGSEYLIATALCHPLNFIRSFGCLPPLFGELVPHSEHARCNSGNGTDRLHPGCDGTPHICSPLARNGIAHDVAGQCRHSHNCDHVEEESIDPIPSFAPPTQRRRLLHLCPPFSSRLGPQAPRSDFGQPTAVVGHVLGLPPCKWAASEIGLNSPVTQQYCHCRAGGEELAIVSKGDPEAIEQPIDVWREKQSIVAIKPLFVRALAPWLDVTGHQNTRVGGTRHSAVGRYGAHPAAEQTLPLARIDQLLLRGFRNRGMRDGLLSGSVLDSPRDVFIVASDQAQQDRTQCFIQTGEIDVHSPCAGTRERGVRGGHERLNLRPNRQRLERFCKARPFNWHKPPKGTPVGARRSVVRLWCVGVLCFDDPNSSNGLMRVREHDISDRRSREVRVGLPRFAIDVSGRAPDVPACHLLGMRAAVVYPPIGHALFLAGSLRGVCRRSLCRDADEPSDKRPITQEAP